MWRVMVHDGYYGSQNSDHHVRLVWAKAPGVMCLLPPRHQADDEDEVNQGQVQDDDGQQGQSHMRDNCERKRRLVR